MDLLSVSVHRSLPRGRGQTPGAFECAAYAETAPPEHQQDSDSEFPPSVHSLPLFLHTVPVTSTFQCKQKPPKLTTLIH